MHCDIYSNSKFSIRAITLRRLRTPYERDFSLLFALQGKRVPAELARDVLISSRRVLDESRLLAAFKHKSIVSVKEVRLCNDYVFWISEAVVGPDLPDRLHALEKQGKGVDEIDASFMFGQMLSAIGWLHSNRVIHRNISSHKWVFTGPDTWEVILVDFASAAQLPESRSWYSENETGTDSMNIGSMYYTAPEILTSRCWSQASDVWALGVVLYETIFSGSMPFFSRKIKDLGRVILNSDPEWDPEEVSPALAGLMAELLNKNPTKRPSIVQVAENPWVKDVEKATAGWIRENSPPGSLRLVPSQRPLPQLGMPPITGSWWSSAKNYR